MDLLRVDCTELFGKKIDTPAVESAMRGHLYQARRNWQQQKRQKTRSLKARTESSDNAA